MKLRFSIRDLLWFTVVVALAVAWWLDHRRVDNQPLIYGISPDGSVVITEKATGNAWIKRGKTWQQIAWATD